MSGNRPNIYSKKIGYLSSIKPEALNNSFLNHSPRPHTNSILSHTYEAPHEDL